MKTRELIEVAQKAGEILLCSGAEIYRVEDTILRIFSSYHTPCECFVLLSGIFISAVDHNGETITAIRRLKEYSINLHRIDLVNSFSRNLEKNPLSYHEAIGILNLIEKTPTYGFPVRLLCAGMTALVYTLLFKGHIYGSIAALVISMVTYTVKEKISEMELFQFFEYFISGLIAGSLSLLAVRLIPGQNLYNIIVGSIMIFVPGVAITNGIKDALYGDIVSSLYRVAQAIFIAIAIASGVGIVLSVGLRWS